MLYDSCYKNKLNYVRLIQVSRYKLVHIKQTYYIICITRFSSPQTEINCVPCSITRYRIVISNRFNLERTVIKRKSFSFLSEKKYISSVQPFIRTWNYFCTMEITHCFFGNPNFTFLSIDIFVFHCSVKLLWWQVA